MLVHGPLGVAYANLFPGTSREEEERGLFAARMDDYVVKDTEYLQGSMNIICSFFEKYTDCDASAAALNDWAPGSAVHELNDRLVAHRNWTRTKLRETLCQDVNRAIDEGKNILFEWNEMLDSVLFESTWFCERYRQLRLHYPLTVVLRCSYQPGPKQDKQTNRLRKRFADNLRHIFHYLEQSGTILGTTSRGASCMHLFNAVLPCEPSASQDTLATSPQFQQQVLSYIKSGEVDNIVILFRRKGETIGGVRMLRSVDTDHETFHRLVMVCESLSRPLREAIVGFF